MNKLSPRARNVANAIESSGATVRPAKSGNHFVIEYPSGTVGTVEASIINELVVAGLLKGQTL